MKKLTTISLFIFGVVLTALLTAGLVFYQNNKTTSQSGADASANLIKDTINKINPGSTLTLDITEISKHNKQTDCWMLISGKVYNITSFFGSHPGGNSTMLATCGTDATAAYMTKDPNATSAGSRSAHSSGATSMLTSYYIGDLNQTIGQQKITDTASVVAPASGDDEYEYEDD